MLRSKLKQWFKEAVLLEPEAPQEMKDYLLRAINNKDPKLDRFLDKMCEQIQQAERLCLKKGVFLKEKTLQDFTYDMAKYFMKGLHGEAVRRHESDLAKAAREAEAQRIKEFESVLAGKPEGEFAEAGVISNEKIDKEREIGFEKEIKTITNF